MSKLCFNFLHVATLHDLLLKEAALDISANTQLSKNIRTMYEWEYKYNKIKQAEHMHQRRKENLLNLVREELTPILDIMTAHILDVYDDWLNHHAIMEPSKWAESRIEGLILEGNNAYDAYIISLLEYQKYNHSSDEYARREFIDANISELSRLAKALLSESIQNIQSEIEEAMSEANTERASDLHEEITYLKNMDVASTEGLSEFADIYMGSTAEFLEWALFKHPGTGIRMMKIFYENKVFPAWFNFWSERGIEQTRNNIESIRNTLQSANSLESSFSALSLALNGMHQTGSMLDYIEKSIDPDVTPEFLEQMSSSNTSKWDVELRDMGVW